MLVYVDSESRIKAVGTTTDTTLTELYINENDDSFPFKGWSTAKICCYKVTVQDGIITMMTPYVDSRILDFVDDIGKRIDSLDIKHETNVANIDYIAMETGIDLDMDSLSEFAEELETKEVTNNE